MGAPELAQGVAKPQPQVSSINRTQFRGHLHHLFPAPWPGGGQGSPQAARVDRALWAKPQSPQPLQGEWIRAPKLPRGGGWHHPDVSGMQTGGERAQHRRHTKPGLPTTKPIRLCSHPHLVPEMSPHAPGKHSCTVHCRDKPDGKHTHTRGPRR